ncbi:MAG: chromate transporter [Bacteroidaceae bacterium]|nr:chromate transporter [Bacteroidaceae bacterium]MBR3758888.1 chromate transporter [Bacteroidaceae bacterium]
MLFLQLFYTFFKIGLFGFGGGYAMLSMIQGEVVTRYGWITPTEFTDIVAISQMTPGPIGINSATYVGYTAIVNAGYAPWMGVLGSATATGAVVLPSFLLMLTISRLLLKHKNHPTVTAIFSGLRPAVVGLLAAAALLLMNSENFGHWATSPLQFTISILLFIAAFLGVKVFKLSPILIILLAGAAGGIIYSFPL